ALVRIGDHLAVNGDFSGDRLEHMDGLEREIALAGAGGEDDAVIAELHFEDVADALAVAIVDLGLGDAARCVGDVDRVVAHALAELAKAAAAAAGAHDRALNSGKALPN